MRRPKTEFEGLPEVASQEYIRALIRHYGSISRVARELHCSPTSIWRWATLRGQPTKRVLPSIYRLYEEIHFGNVKPGGAS